MSSSRAKGLKWNMAALVQLFTDRVWICTDLADYVRQNNNFI